MAGDRRVRFFVTIKLGDSEGEIVGSVPSNHVRQSFILSCRKNRIMKAIVDLDEMLSGRFQNTFGVCRETRSSCPEASRSGSAPRFLQPFCLPYPTIGELSRLLAGVPVETGAPDVPSANHRGRSEPIAVIGVGCRLPGTSNPEAFWGVPLRRHRASEVPANRWDLSVCYDRDPHAPGRYLHAVRGIPERDRPLRRVALQYCPTRGPQDLYELSFERDQDFGEVYEKEKPQQITDSSAIEKIIDEIIAANPKQVEQYRAGKKTVVGFFVGQVMKASKGQANPQMVNELLAKKLES